MTQTAIEWLLEQLENQVSDDGKQTMSLKVTGFLREQAKEMEKQQIIDAWLNGVEKEGEPHGHTYFYNDTKLANQYYNETFNK
jgi:hypothetical protein